MDADNGDRSYAIARTVGGLVLLGVGSVLLLTREPDTAQLALIFTTALILLGVEVGRALMR